MSVPVCQGGAYLHHAWSLAIDDTANKTHQDPPDQTMFPLVLSTTVDIPPNQRQDKGVNAFDGFDRYGYISDESGRVYDEAEMVE